MIEFGHATHVGLQRTRNEDTYHADAALGLFLVADGMGGHLHGEVAAALVRDTVVAMVGKGHGLAEAILHADELLLAQANPEPGMPPMGSTIAALRVTGNGYEAAWVGDSRIYVSGKEFRQVSHDHSLVQALVENGQLDAAHAARHPQRNVLTQALGITPPEQLLIGMAKGLFTPGTGLLLCSDGLTESLDNTAIARTVLRAELGAQECIDHLVIDALDRGGKDNITAILVRSS